MRFLVTGTTGFAGPHMINRILQSGHQVVAMHRNAKKCATIVNVVGEENYSKIEFVYGDLEDLDSLSTIFDNDVFDGVFHLGAFAHPPSSFITPLLANQTNILGTGHICDKILEKMPNCVLMNCSTPEVYGLCPTDNKIAEDFPMKPNNPYGVSKAAADMYMIERIKTEGLRGFLTRAFSHTGPRRGANFSISSDAVQIARILRSKQEPVIKIGNMRAKRIVADVRDIVDVYYQLMMAHFDGKVEDGEIFHIAGNDLHEMQHYLDIMLKQTGLAEQVTLEIEPKFLRKVENPVQIPDDSKVRKLLNWQPKIPIEQTLQDLVHYWLREIDNGN
jgi:GDP-4-dehydro-6-deoxy-D-mannose reductase|tara:strand:- start:293 stop:1288 length:996 start_codon:yes stop_codon:yes gene_type:complete